MRSPFVAACVALLGAPARNTQYVDRMRKSVDLVFNSGANFKNEERDSSAKLKTSLFSHGGNYKLGVKRLSIVKFMRNRTLNTLLIFILTSGCATLRDNYDKGLPNFNAKDRDATTKKIETHVLDEKSLWTGGHYVSHGDEYYTIEAVQPLLKEVSPKAFSKMETASTLRTLQLASLALALGSLVGYIASPRDSTASQIFWPAYLGLSVISIGFGLGNVLQINSAVHQYNTDLKNRFAQ